MLGREAVSDMKLAVGSVISTVSSRSQLPYVAKHYVMRFASRNDGSLPRLARDTNVVGLVLVVLYCG